MQPQVPRAADTVVLSIEQRIQSGGLPDGAALPPERDLMTEFGVSRTVVREALRILSSRGLVDARPRHRPVVRKPDIDAAMDAMGGVVGQLLGQPGGVRNLFDTRILVEAALARQAAQEAGRDHMVALRDALSANEAAIEDNARFFETDVAFHGVLYAIPLNPVLPALHRAYSGWLAPQWTQMPRSTDRNALNHASHAAIFDAIAMRDPDGAEAALRAHLADAWQQVSETFGDI